MLTLTNPWTPMLSVYPNCCNRLTVSSTSNQPTHTAGHTLDLVIARADSPVCDLLVGDFISDHALASFKVEGAK